MATSLYSTTIKANQLALAGNAALGSDVAGANDGLYAAIPGAPGITNVFDPAPMPDTAEFGINVPVTGYYTLDFRYANGSLANGYRQLVVDGKNQSGLVQFKNGFATNNWLDTTESVFLTQGTHTVLLTNDAKSSQGGLSASDPAILLNQVTVRQGASPSSQTSANSLAMNNWSDMVGIVQGALPSQASTNAFGPSLAELHYSANWDINQLDYNSLWFRNVTPGQQSQTYAPYFASSESFDERGILTVQYGNYLPTGQALPVSIKEEYAMVPNQPLLVERVTLLNQQEYGTPTLQWNVMNVMKLNASLQQQAVWDPRREAWIAKLDQGSGNAPVYLAFGSFQSASQHGAGTDGEDVREEGLLPFLPGSRDPSTSVGGTGVVGQFENTGKTGGNGQSASGSGLALSNERDQIGLDPGRPIELYYYTTMATSLQQLDQNIATALNPQQTATPGSPALWMNLTAKEWASKLSNARNIPGTESTQIVQGQTATPVAGATLSSVDDPALQTTYFRSLVTILQSQQPQYGSFLASTNPAYAYKVWPRDGAATALGLDAAGLTDDADHYWRWMASVQQPGTGSNASEFPKGSFYTNYAFFDANKPINFVQPENDAQGLFLIGSFRHYGALIDAGKLQEAKAFITDPVVSAALIASADFISDRIEPNGFGPQDLSIWEEIYQYNTYTQITYAEGLNAAALLAPLLNATDRQASWATGAATIRDAILRPTTAAQPGLWDTQKGHFVQGVTPSGFIDEKLDASTNLAIVLGLLPADDPRAASQIAATIAVLSKDNFGISRYQGDTFYSASPYSPGGEYESRVDEAAWPQMTSYVGIAKQLQGDPEYVRNGLQWIASSYGTGYTAPGEGVDWSTGQPLPSTMSEPVTASWFIQDLLTATGQYNSRLPAINGAVVIDSSAAQTGLVLLVSQDAYQGDAQYTVSVDGNQVGGTRTASAAHSGGAKEAVSVPTQNPGAHTVTIDFLNDRWDGTASTDRNLFVDATINGGSVSNAALTFWSQGTQTFTFVQPEAATMAISTLDAMVSAYVPTAAALAATGEGQAYSLPEPATAQSNTAFMLATTGAQPIDFLQPTAL